MKQLYRIVHLITNIMEALRTVLIYHDCHDQNPPSGGTGALELHLQLTYVIMQPVHNAVGE